MPSAKKRKQQKQEDFKKKKLKVGKKKALPDNYTDTSFKSKSISLPSQSVTEDKSKQATTSRNLTLSDLLSQMRHYNASVRKEAISGLREWAIDYPGLLVSNLGTIVNGIVKLFVDDDRDVRKALLPFLQEHIANLRKADLDPFLPIMIMYTCSAMTHIFEDVRNDAVKIMDLWVKVAPDVVRGKFWDKIVGIYSSLLTVDSNEMSASKSNAPALNTTGNASGSTMKAMISKSHLHLHKTRLDLLTSLSNFLETGLTTSRRDPMWFLLDSLKDQNAKKAYKDRLKRYYKDETAKTVSWNPEDPTSVYFPHPELFSYVTYLASCELSQLNLFESSGPQSTGKILKEEEKTSDTHPLVLLETFQSILVSSWLETAPSVFTASSITNVTPALQLLHIVIRLTLIIGRVLVNDDDTSEKDYSWLDKHLLSLLKYFMTYFPYGADTLGNRPAEVDSLLREMNAAVCELTSIYMLEKSAQSQKAIEHPSWTKKMVNYVLHSIGYEDGKEGVTSLSWQFKEEDLVSLLPAIWGFWNSLEDNGRYKLFKAFMNFYNFTSPNSGVKQTALQFLIRVYLLESTPSYNAEFSVRSSPKYTQLLQKWFSSLPKTLWQLKTSYIHVSRVILNFLCDVARENDKSVFNDEILRSTELAMVPFFYVNLPKKGPLYGPFINLPVDLQQRALEFIYYIASGSQKVRDAISACQEHVSVKVIL